MGKLKLYTILLLAVYASVIKPITTYQKNRHRENGTVSKGTYSLPTREWDITSIGIRTKGRYHQHWIKKSVSYTGYEGKNQAGKRTPHHREWEEVSKHVKNCPLGCVCVLTKDPLFFRPFRLMLSVQDCAADPSPHLLQLFDSHRDVQSIEMKNCSLSSLPHAILTWHSLLGLYLIGNGLREIPNEIQQLQALRVFSLVLNSVEHIRMSNITKLPNLEFLDISQNRIALLPSGIENMRSLWYLNASYNTIQHLPEGLWALKKLSHLYVSHNNIMSIPQGMWKLTQLEYLWLSYNHIRHMSIGSFTNVVQLNIDYNKLEAFPSELGNLAALEELDLGHNMITEVPSSIGKLTKLTHVLLDGNLIQRLPDTMRDISHLSVLVLEDNLIEQVPMLMQVIFLWLKRNQIKSIPCEILNEGQIVSLELSENYLNSFECVEANLKLIDLNISHNRVVNISCEFHMENLETLDISFNNISMLPKGCTPFSSTLLERLDFSFNNLSTLYLEQLCGGRSLVSYRILDFNSNRINTIKSGLSNLKHCFQEGAVINLANNKISILDSWPLSLAENMKITLNAGRNNLSNFSNSFHSFPPIFKAGTAFLLQQNQIRHFKDVFDGWRIIINTTEDINTLLKTTYFNLSGNPLVCDCVDYGVYKYIQTLRMEEYSELMCQEPQSLRGQNPHHIPLGSFVCDLDVKCPPGCSCVEVPHSKTVNISCTSYIETDLPKVLPDLPLEKYTYRLEICHQNLSEITSRPYLQLATELILSNNTISTARFVPSWNSLKNVKILHLNGNRLVRFPQVISQLTNGSLMEIRIGSNPWLCDCGVMAMTEWITKYWYIIKDINIVTCHSPPGMVGVKVADIERSTVCPNENKTAVYVVGAISSAVLICILYFGITDSIKYPNLRFVRRDECDGEGKVFDIFMCSSSDDGEYVEKYLIPELERRNFRVCYHREHFCGGKPINVNMSEAIEKSKRTLAFFSNNFRDSGYSMFEFHSALDLDIQNKTRRLVTIKDTDLDMNKLDTSEKCYFRTHTYIVREDPKFWKLLEGSLPRKRLGAQVRLVP